MRSPLEPRLTNLVGALSQALTDQMVHDEEAVSGLREAGPAALVSLHESPAGRSIDELRRLVGLTHSGAVRLVDRLVSLGYVARGTGRDGRSVGLTLTASGADLARQVRAARLQTITDVLETLSEADRGQLESLCVRLLTSVTENRLRTRDQGLEPPGGALCRLCDFTACGRPTGQCPAVAAVAAHGAEGEDEGIHSEPGSGRPPALSEGGISDGVEQLELLAANAVVDDARAALTAAVSLRRLADTWEDAGVVEAMNTGWRWSQVAEVLGVTRQAVHKKHARRLTALGTTLRRR